VGDPGRRLHAGLLLIAFVLIIFAARLFQLQGVDSAVYASDADKQYAATQTLPAPRGEILDRNGTPMAESVAARDIVADPSLARSSTKTNPGAMAAKLAPLVGVDRAKLAALLTGSGRFAYLARGVSPATAAAVLKLRLPGISAVDTEKRVYPQGDVAANVVGFVGTDGTGLGGLEYEYQDLLGGKPGTRTVQVASNGTVIPDGHSSDTPAVPGSSLELTIDSDIQWKAQQAIAAAVSSGIPSAWAKTLPPPPGMTASSGAAPAWAPPAPGRPMIPLTASLMAPSPPSTMTSSPCAAAASSRA